MLMTMRKHDDPAQAPAADVHAGLTPMIIDLGKHLIQQPSRHPRGCIVNVQQLTSSKLYHQSYVTGLRPIPSVCCMQPTFWQAPGARKFCEKKRGTAVVMVFTCFADYQSLYQPGMQDAAEDAVTIFKGCVQQALDIADGYECQEVNAVFMLTFHTPTDAVRFHLVLQQLLLVSDWTPEMLALPPMKPEWSDSGDLLFRGPRVKTGVYQGQPRSITPHSTTGRADYWGPLVNRAARMMAGARGGQLLCMKEVADEVRIPRFIARPTGDTWAGDRLGPCCTAAGQRGGEGAVSHKHAGLQALDPNHLEQPGMDSWHVLAFKTEKSVVVRNGEVTTVCDPEVPHRFDQEVPKELAQAWLGNRLALACEHLYGNTAAEDREAMPEEASDQCAPPRVSALDVQTQEPQEPAAILWTHGPEGPRICRDRQDLSRPEYQLHYTHEVQVHDVGMYRFKGISTDFSIKSINVAALEGRNAGYVGGLKSGKAKQVAVGRGQERVRHSWTKLHARCLHTWCGREHSVFVQTVLMSMPTPAVMLERLNWQSELQDVKPASSRGSVMLKEVDMDDFQIG